MKRPVYRYWMLGSEFFVHITTARIVGQKNWWSTVIRINRQKLKKTH